MTSHVPGVALGAWLADRDDDDLVRLMTLRPDLTSPPPGSVAALAVRAQSRQSLQAAVEHLDFRALAILDALVALGATDNPVPEAELRALPAGAGPAADAALAALRARALVWGDGALQVCPETLHTLPWYPGQVTAEQPPGDPAAVRRDIDALDAPQRDILGRLSSGNGVGRTRDAAPDTPADRPVQRLLHARLLRALDDETVVLPRLVWQTLRGEQPGPVDLTPPPLPPARVPTADADAAAAGAALDLLRELDVLLDVLAHTPAPELRSGGLGVREVRRLTKLSGIDEPRLGLLLEVAASAGLIASGLPDPPPAHGAGNASWAPTVQADRFAELSTAARWHQIASTWLALPSRPGLVGRRGSDDKPLGALTDALFSSAAPLDRRLYLGMLADAAPGTALDAAAASTTLLWLRPRWAARLQPEPVADLIDEATALGVIGRGALTTATRALLAGDTDGAVAAMDRALPAPIEHFLLQADLTVVVPGPLTRDLAERLGVVADVESAGAATVYRISEASVRRALDTGVPAGELQAFFARHSTTPVPQGLSYLVDDVARRHGRLRAGVAASFVRCEDPALLAQVMAAPLAADLALRLLAPTVAVSAAPLADLLAGMRAAGFAPAAEDAMGAVVDLRSRGARVAAVAGRRTHRPATPDEHKLRAIVGVLRRVAAAPSAQRLDAATAVTALQDAVRRQTSVVIGYVDAAGVATQRVVAPVSVRGGQLMAFDPASGRVRDFAVHRVSSVVAVPD